MESSAVEIQSIWKRDATIFIVSLPERNVFFRCAAEVVTKAHANQCQDILESERRPRKAQ